MSLLTVKKARISNQVNYDVSVHMQSLILTCIITVQYFLYRSYHSVNCDYICALNPKYVFSREPVLFGFMAIQLHPFLAKEVYSLRDFFETWTSRKLGINSSCVSK